jgi:hypothetical protein
MVANGHGRRKSGRGPNADRSCAVHPLPPSATNAVGYRLYGAVARRHPTPYQSVGSEYERSQLARDGIVQLVALHTLALCVDGQEAR